MRRREADPESEQARAQDLRIIKSFNYATLVRGVFAHKNCLYQRRKEGGFFVTLGPKKEQITKKSRRSDDGRSVVPYNT